MDHYIMATDPELGRLIKMRSRLGGLAPGYAGIVYGLELVESTRTKTMAVDGKHMFWNREFVRSISDAELMAVILHEGLHITLGHHLRRNGRDPDLWNVAGDYVINPIVVNASLELPEGALLNWDYDGMTAEQVFKLLGKQQLEDGDGKADGDDTSDDSDNAGDSTDGDADGEGEGDAAAAPSGQPENFDHAGEVWDATDDDGEALDATETQAALDKLQRDIIVSAMAEKAAGSGTVSIDGGIVDAAKTMPVDWKEALADFLQRQYQGEPTFAKGNRRHLGNGDYFPSQVGVGGGDLVIAIDTSGSVSQNEAEAFANEINSIRETIQPERTIVMYCDSHIQKNADGELYDLFESHEDIEVRNIRGGGTQFDPPFYLVEHEGLEVDAFIYFTDGWAYVSQKVCSMVEYPVLWATTGCEPTFSGDPFGEIIEVTI